MSGFSIEIYLMILLLSAMIFILLRFFLAIYKPKDQKIKTTNIQNLGDREYQSNYFTIIHGRMGSLQEKFTPNFSSNNSETIFAALADGIVDTKSGRLSAILAVDVLKTNFMKKNFKSFSQFFETSKLQIQKSLGDNINSNNLNLFLTAIKIENNVIHYANSPESNNRQNHKIGNTIIVYRNKEIIYLEGNYPFFLKPKDIIMLASSGTIENLKEVYIHWYLGLTDLSLKEKGFQLQKKVLEVLKSRNSTIILLEMPAKNLAWEKRGYED